METAESSSLNDPAIRYLHCPICGLKWVMRYTHRLDVVLNEINLHILDVHGDSDLRLIRENPIRKIQRDQQKARDALLRSEYEKVQRTILAAQEHPQTSFDTGAQHRGQQVRRQLRGEA